MTRLSWLDFSTATDVGRSRARNEDAVGWRHDEGKAGGPLLLVVADGMGGHAAGDVASQLAVQTVLDTFFTLSNPDYGARLSEAIRDANRRILQSASQSPERTGMGTTCVAAAWAGNHVTLANVGDSRAYLLRDGELSQLTEDHSWVQEQVRNRLLSPEEARHHPMRNLITRALGTDGDVEPDIVRLEVRPGDTLLLCSDGLCGVLLDDEIRAILATAANAESAAAELIRAANDRGGPDNITVAIGRMLSSPAEGPATGAKAEAGVGAPAARHSEHRFSVVIPTWNGWHHLERCLDALAQQHRPADEIIVVDNGSTDGTLDALRGRFPHVQVVALGHNLGFAAAMNRGLAAATGNLLVSLNNDTRPAPDWLAALERAYLAASGRGLRVGAIASLLVRASDPSTIDSAGISLDRSGLAWDRLGGQPVSTLRRELTPVFGACAGAALYTREMLDDAGGFAEEFFAYLDDVDLAWRAKQRGWHALLAVDAVVLHEHSGSFGATSAWKRRLLGRNKVRLLVRNYPTDALLRNLPWILLFDAIALAGAIVTPSQDGLRGILASFAGRVEGLLALPSLLRERRAIQARATVPFELVGLAPVASPLAAIARYRHLWAAVRRVPAGAH